MKISQTPTLLPEHYTRSQALRMEVAKVISVRDNPHTSAASKTAINAFLSAVGGGAIPSTSAIVANGAKVPATGSGAVATVVVSNGVVTGVTLAAS